MQRPSRCEVGGFSSFESAPSIVEGSRKLSREVNSGAATRGHSDHKDCLSPQPPSLGKFHIRSTACGDRATGKDFFHKPRLRMRQAVAAHAAKEQAWRMSVVLIVRSFLMEKLTICAAFLLAAVGGSYAADAWAADDMPTKAPSATTPSTAAPPPCADPADFITTNCQLTWHGITLFGAVDMGFGWQSHGAPFDPISAVTSSYLIQKQNQGSLWTRTANGMSNYFIGIKGTEPIGGDFSVVFDLDAGFDPYSLRLSNGPGSIAAMNGVPQNLQDSYSDSSRAGQFYDGQGYVGVSSPTYGTLTVFRQNSLTLDAVFDYDPFGASYAFSPIGFQGITCGGGNTQNCRHSTSLKYRINVGQFRAAALGQFGGYPQKNASDGAYQFQAGGDISTWGKGVLSLDAIYSHVRDSVSVALAPGSNNANGVPIPPFLPQTLTATISDNEAVMLVAKYTNGPLKVYAGYEHIRYMAPSNPQTAFTDISGSFLCLGCDLISNTSINNA